MSLTAPLAAAQAQGKGRPTIPPGQRASSAPSATISAALACSRQGQPGQGDPVNHIARGPKLGAPPCAKWRRAIQHGEGGVAVASPGGAAPRASHDRTKRRSPAQDGRGGAPPSVPLRNWPLLPQQRGKRPTFSKKGRFLWCPRSDSNRHALRRRILNPLRLPFRHSGHRFAV